MRKIFLAALIFLMSFLCFGAYADSEFIMKFDLSNQTMSSVDVREFSATITLTGFVDIDEDSSTYDAADCDLSGLTVTPEVDNKSVASLVWDDSSGKLILTALNNGTTNCRIYYSGTIITPNGKSYTAENSNSDNYNIEVTNDGKHDSNNDTYSGSGGCNIGVSVLFALPLFLLRKRIRL